MGSKGERIWEQRLRKLITKGKTAYGVCLWGAKVKGYGSHLKLQKNKDFCRSHVGSI
jgi:CRISPR/Cas system CSM-associated protein Csm3 (group 7 of RAMP superfamily)